MRNATAVLIGILALIPAELRAQDVKTLLKGAKETKTAAKEIPAATKAALAKALPGAFDPAKDGKVTLHTSKGLPNPEDATDVYETAWTVVVDPLAVTAWRDPDTGELTVVSVHATGKLPAGLPEDYLGRFAKKVLSPNSSNPPDMLRDLRAKAAAGADDKAKQLQALLSLNEAMMRVENREDAWDEVADRPEGKAVAKEMVEALEKALGGLKQAGFVFTEASAADAPKAERQTAGLAKAAEKASGEAKAFLEAAEAGNGKLARQRLNAVSCGSCHANNRKVFRQARLARGIGDGYFMPGHDLQPVPDDAKAGAEAVGQAVRKGLLLIDAATQ